ncbi:MAG: hypothetical protein D6679_09675 [Candidatus Hydrogenedentota bacterium]|nr:MAG: hypothetical protein D6679_09675 [Candidatus Hydrogenedentota bacterium]
MFLVPRLRREPKKSRFDRVAPLLSKKNELTKVAGTKKRRITKIRRSKIISSGVPRSPGGVVAIRCSPLDFLIGWIRERLERFFQFFAPFSSKQNYWNTAIRKGMRETD